MRSISPFLLSLIFVSTKSNILVLQKADYRKSVFLEFYLILSAAFCSSDEDDKIKFGLDIPVSAMLKEYPEDILHHAPDWWKNEDKEFYDILIFIMPSARTASADTGSKLTIRTANTVRKIVGK